MDIRKWRGLTRVRSVIFFSPHGEAESLAYSRLILRRSPFESRTQSIGEPRIQSKRDGSIDF